MAQEREKTRIVLASILKPVDDTRMTAKMGASLATAGFSVSVIGHGKSGQAGRIILHGLGNFKRLDLGRFTARWKVLKTSFATRPHVFIFSTYELIGVALILKIALGTKIIYDIRENYYRNIRFSEGLPSLLRWPLALLVRGGEKVTAPMIDHFFLAEESYDQEFRFHRGGWTLLENKALPGRSRSHGIGKGIQLLFSGTLSDSTGVFRAISFAERLHDAFPEVALTIAGYAAVERTQKRIREMTHGKQYIRLVGIDQLVPHDEIQTLIEQSHAGIIAYRRLPHTAHAVPTKLFEYLEASLPVITEAGWPWIARFENYSPFILADIDHPNPDAVLSALQTHQFYRTPATEAGWGSEAPKLTAAVKDLV